MRAESAASAERNAEVMRCYLEQVVGEGKFELIPELAAEDMEDHTNDIPGRAGLVAHVTGFRERIPDVEVTVQRVIASADEVVGVWRWQGTHSADMFGVPATGRQLDVVTASIFEMRDGMIVDYRVVTGALQAVQQMGVSITL